MMEKKDEASDKKWFDEGYEQGHRFSRYEADYDELAAVSRAKKIPANWDIYRAEILNTYLGDKSFDFKEYEAGFVKACMEFFDKL